MLCPAQHGRFGDALAVGDFDHDGRDDLAISVPAKAGDGAVHILYGGSTGLSSCDQYIESNDYTFGPGCNAN